MRVLRVADADLAALASPLARTSYAEPTVIVTVPDGTAPEPPARALASVPCIVVGDGHDTAGNWPHLDLFVEPDVTTLDDVLDTIDTHPYASLTLAMLLRAAPRASASDAVAMESAAYSMLLASSEFAAWRAQHPPRDRPADPDEPVRLRRDGSTLHVILNRPQVRNALNRAMRDRLLEAFALAATAPDIEQVEVRGVGRSFCSGGDLDEFGTFDDPARAHVLRLATSIGQAIASMSDRVTFFVHGPCAGSGVELPAFGSRVVADPATTFLLPEVSLGLVPGAGGTVSLTRRIGRHRVALLALGGRAIDATVARRWGLVDELAPTNGAPA